MPCLSRAVDLGDLHVYDPVAMNWTDLSSPASGNPPSPRDNHGFTSTGGKLYVHGGWNGTGDFLSHSGFVAKLRFWLVSSVSKGDGGLKR